MAAKTSSKSETLGNRIKKFFTPSDDADPPQEEPQPAPATEPDTSKFTLRSALRMKEKGCCNPKDRCCCCGCGLFGKLVYLLLSIIAVFKAIGLIIIAVIVAIGVKAYDSEHNGKAAALVLLVLSGGVTIVLVLYSDVLLFQKKGKKLKKLALFLFLLALFQLILTLVAITPNGRSEKRLTNELADSFEKAQRNNPKHLKQWASTQYGLACCGLYSPEDYRMHGLPISFPPDVPISCCPTYDPNRPPLTQERERELCKSGKRYYTKGCAAPIVTYFGEAGVMVTSLVAGLFLLQIILAISNCCCGRWLKPKSVPIDAERTKTPTPTA